MQKLALGFFLITIQFICSEQAHATSDFSSSQLASTSNSTVKNPKSGEDSRRLKSAFPEHLVVGQKHFINSSAPILIGDAKIIEAKEQGAGLILIGKSPGTTFIRIYDHVMNIQVLSTESHLAFNCLQKVASSSVELQAKTHPSRPAMTGTLRRIQEWSKLNSVCGDFVWNASFSVSEGLRKEFLETIRAEAKDLGFTVPRLRWGKKIEVVIPDGKKASEAFENWLASYGIHLTREADIQSAPPQVRTRVIIAEVKSDFARNLGVDWPSGYNAQLIKESPTTNSGFFANAQVLEKEGAGRLLARPELLSRSGTEASFWAGGELPITVIGPRSREVHWKKFGILLKVIASADAFGNMSLQIATEVSSLASAQSPEGIPSINMNRMETHFDLSSSRTVVLSGLLRSDDFGGSSGLPGLKEIPILGSLFSSRNFREAKTELVIMVRPEIEWLE